MATKSHFLEGKKIIVAGAGFASLAFIIAFHKNWDPALKRPEIIVYERSARHLPRSRQGYSVSVNGFDENGGLVAARDLGVLDQVMDKAVTGNDSVTNFCLWSADWTELMGIKFKPYQDIPSSGIRIIRNDLREIYVAAAEKLHRVRWKTMCTSAERLSDGRIRVHVSPSDGEGKSFTDDCDLLIAADGAHSKIRASLRPGDNLEYAGAIQMGGVATFPSGMPEHVSKNWGMVISGEGVGCFFSPVGTNSVFWALGFLEPERQYRHDPTSKADLEALKTEALDRGHMLKEPFQSIVKATEFGTSFMNPARDKKPFGHASDPNLQSVMFLGDSNHPVSPFAGNGANMALKDGVDLAQQLCGALTRDEAVAAYDKLALPRANKTLQQSRQRIGHSHCTGLYYYSLRGMLWAGSRIMFMLGQL